jgi:hypothetical protein
MDNFREIITREEEIRDINIIIEEKYEKMTYNIFMNNSNIFNNNINTYRESFIKSLWNNYYVIKTIYNILFRITIIDYRLREKCKCCNHNKETEKTEELITMINKFFNVIKLLPCECNYRKMIEENDKENNRFIREDYLNFLQYMKIYNKTINKTINLLIDYYKLDKNKFNKEISILDEKYCIHEDIRFNNMVNCKKNKNEINKKGIDIGELVNKLYNMNIWIYENYKVNILYYNFQSYTYFLELINRYETEYTKNNKNNNIFIENINRIYKISNEILNIEFNINNKKIIHYVINSNFDNEFIISVLNILFKQIKLRNNINKEYNDIIVEYIFYAINLNRINIGINILKNYNYNNFKEENELLISLYDNIIENKNIILMDKILFLEIICENRMINNYDFINKIIENYDGDKIMNKFIDNNIFLINDKYNNEVYIKNIIKKTLLYNKPIILGYILKKFRILIELYEIRIIDIYFNYINKNNEYENINLLKMIIYSKIVKSEINLAEYCINNNLYLSFKLLISNKIIKPSFIDLINAINNNNFIITYNILIYNPEFINYYYDDKIRLINYLFENNCDDNFIIRILFVLLKKDIIDVNYDDNYNSNIVYEIINSNFDKYDKIKLIKYIIDRIDCIKIYNNIPLIMYSIILDEYEICYILLKKMMNDKLVINRNIYLDNNILNYYLEDNNNINYVPFIVKYIKDIYENEKYKKNILYIDSIIDNNLLIIDEILIIIFNILLVLASYYIKENNNDENKTQISINNNDYSNFTNNNSIKSIKSNKTNKSNSNIFIKIGEKENKNRIKNQLYIEEIDINDINN